jgi:hypothetical protein
MRGFDRVRGANLRRRAQEMPRWERFTYGALAGVHGAACMSALRMAAHRLGLIDRMPPQVLEEWLVARSGAAAWLDEAGHHVTDHVLHLAIGGACGLVYIAAARFATRGSPHHGRSVRPRDLGRRIFRPVAALGSHPSRRRFSSRRECREHRRPRALRRGDGADYYRTRPAATGCPVGRRTTCAADRLGALRGRFGRRDLDAYTGRLKETGVVARCASQSERGP